LANFSTLFAKVPNDKEFIKNTEIGLGVNVFASYIMQRLSLPPQNVSLSELL
jgi:hypothetical protein